MLIAGSLFSGIGGFDEGFCRVGIRTAWMAEKEPFCRAVLATHFPDIPILEDVVHVSRSTVSAVDIITAGFPCQDLSVAGKRAGLEGARSGLFWEVIRILREIQPLWFVLENVPGLFSSKNGQDFAIALNALDELGYGVAWRVLDSQFFGVAQRRRRVFIVGCFGKPCPEEILFEPEGGAGDIAEGREAGAGIAFALAASVRGTGDGHGNAWNSTYVPIAHTLSAANHDTSHAAGQRREDDFNLAVIQDVRGGTRDRTDSGQEIGIREGGPSYTLSVTEQHAVAFTLPSEHRGVGYGHNTNYIPERAPFDSDGVRDFAGLPEGMDSARYRALGNAVTASVAEWIGRRIMEYQC